MKTHYVIDLETLGTDETAIIASIGVVRVHNLQIEDEAYYPIDLENSVALGRTMDLPTVLWWLRQPVEVRDQLLLDAEPRLVLDRALRRLADFMMLPILAHRKEQALVWGNGAPFDCNILRHAYRQLGMPAPWPYTCDRDLRTLLELYPAAREQSGPFEGIRHHALHDARHEARQLIAALQMHA